MTYKNNGNFVNIYNFHNFRCNILDNVLQPKFRVLNETEKNEIKKKYNITSDSNFQEISRFDPVALVIGIRPGQITEIIRKSPTALQAKTWRICL